MIGKRGAGMHETEAAKTATGHDAAMLHYYSAQAPVYRASGQGGTSRHLAAFLALLPARAHVLDLGCGGGGDAQAMLAAGHRVDAVDGTPGIARQAEARLGMPVQVMRFDQLDAQDRHDAVWASASLLHVPRPALPAILSRLRAALKPDGLHHATYKGGGKEGRDRHGRYFNYFSREALIAAREQADGWDIRSVSTYTGGGQDDGAQGPWLAILARRAG